MISYRLRGRYRLLELMPRALNSLSIMIEVRTIVVTQAITSDRTSSSPSRSTRRARSWPFSARLTKTSAPASARYNEHQSDQSGAVS